MKCVQVVGGSATREIHSRDTLDHNGRSAGQDRSAKIDTRWRQNRMIRQQRYIESIQSIRTVDEDSNSELSGRNLGNRGKRPVFFLQAEDGIRDGHVTGVQTCALPI